MENCTDLCIKKELGEDEDKKPKWTMLFSRAPRIVICALMLVIMGATIECQMIMMIRRIEINERRSDTLFIKSFIIRKK